MGRARGFVGWPFLGKFFLLAVALPMLVLAWIVRGACNDIEAEKELKRRTNAHRAAVVKAELDRIEAASAKSPPRTLGEARKLIGRKGWCGGGGKATRGKVYAEWRPHYEIPLGVSQVWPLDDEHGGPEYVRAYPEVCDDTAPIDGLSVARGP